MQELLRYEKEVVGEKMLARKQKVLGVHSVRFQRHACTNTIATRRNVANTSANTSTYAITNTCTDSCTDSCANSCDMQHGCVQGCA